MNQSLKRILGTIYSFLVVFLLFSRCTLPEVKEQERGFVTIASDFLEKKDTVLFKNFQKKAKTKIRIVHMSADSIRNHFKKFKYNAKIDLVFLNSSRSMFSLSQNGVLHTFNSDFLAKHASFCSPKNNFIAIGIDPYVFDYGDSTAKNVLYHDLTKSTLWDMDLENQETTAFFSSVLHQFGLKKKSQAKSWIKKLMLHEQAVQKESERGLRYLLSRFSKAHASKHKVSFPNQYGDGCYADHFCMGIVKNSKNYMYAEKLINYFLNENNNEILTAKISAFPMIDPKGRSSYKFQNDYPNVHRSTLKQTIPFYRATEKLIKEIQKEIDSKDMVKPKKKKPSTNASPIPADRPAVLPID